MQHNRSIVECVEDFSEYQTYYRSYIGSLYGQVWCRAIFGIWTLDARPTPAPLNMSTSQHESLCLPRAVLNWGTSACSGNPSSRFS